jgi:7-cyano-7-deazaguanine synthase
MSWPASNGSEGQRMIPGMDLPGHLAVLVSGGLDSAVLAALLREQGSIVHPIYVRFGLAWEPAEEAHLRRFLDTLPGPGLHPLVVLDEPVADLYGAHWSVSGENVPDAASPDAAVYLPGRSLLLLAKSAVWCALHAVPAIALGTLRGNPFPDSSADFFDRFGALIGLGLSHQLSVLAPFAGMTKAEVLQRGRHLQLHQTFSCIDPRDGMQCGRCNKCAERRAAFVALSIDDDTSYARR